MSKNTRTAPDRYAAGLPLGAVPSVYGTLPESTATGASVRPVAHLANPQPRGGACQTMKLVMDLVKYQVPVETDAKVEVDHVEK